jgi:hypothetical protein
MGINRQERSAGGLYITGSVQLPVQVSRGSLYSFSTA